MKLFRYSVFRDYLQLTTLLAMFFACAPSPADGKMAVAASSVAGISIAGVADRGHNAGRHYFELYGDFSGSSPSVAVFCGNAQVPSRREYASTSQINTSIAELPSGTRCNFSVSTSPYSIAGVQDRGSSDGRRFFELYGTFPGPDPYSLSVAVCGGVTRSAQIEFQSSTQINVSVADLPQPATCTFPLAGNARYASYGPLLIQAPEVELAGVNDRGVSGGERHFELYGRFSVGSLAVESICNGALFPTRLTYSSSGQVNIALTGSLGGDWICAFTATGVVSGRPVRSPVFHKPSTNNYPAMPDFLGAYYWGGRHLSATDTPLATATSALRASGFRTARFVLNPRVRGELIPSSSASLPYGIDTTTFNADCPPGTPFLPCAVRHPVYRDAISPPDLRTIVFTAYDSATSGDYGWGTGYVDETFVDDHENQIIEEYRALTLALYETQAGSGKTFIIANWEGDNHVYCGSAYQYSYDEGFRGKCPHAGDYLNGLRAWFKLRKRGIGEGRAMAAALGYSGVHVADGIEFNSFHMMNDRGYRSVLFDIIPEVRPEWASYSSWETIDHLASGNDAPRMARDLLDLKNYLAQTTAGTRLMIGEAGFDGTPGDRTDAVKIRQSALIAQSVELFNTANIPVVILWAAQNSMPGANPATGEVEFIFHEGLYNADGSERSNLRAARTRAMALPAQTRPSIAGTIFVGGDRWTAHVELYGNYPGGNNSNRRYDVKAICTNASGAEVESWIAETYESGGQINVAVPRPTCGGSGCITPERSCRFVPVAKSDFTAGAASAPTTVRWP